MPIHTAADIDAMPDAHKIDLFADLGERAYGTPRFHTRFARDSGYARRTFYNWATGESPIPTVALLLLQEWANRRTTPDSVLAALNSVAAEIEKAAKRCRDIANQTAADLRSERKFERVRLDDPTEELTAAERDAAGPAPEPAARGIDLSRL